MATGDKGAADLVARAVGESSVVLDREGRFWHDGEPVTHPGVAAALHRWIDIEPETGRFVLRVGAEVCHLTVEDTPYFVRRVRVTGAGVDSSIDLELSDGTVEPLDYGSLEQAPSNVLYCRVKGGRFAARFDRAPYYRIAERVELRGDEGFLPAAGKLWPIRACVGGPSSQAGTGSSKT